MVDVLGKVLQEIKMDIPEEILRLAFMRKDFYYKDRATNLDREIIDKVIAARVNVDCSLNGGMDYVVALLDSYRELTEEMMSVYTIPKSLLDGRSIVSVLSVMYLNPYMVAAPASLTTCGWSNIMATSQAVLDAMSPIPNFTTAEVQLGGENVIVVRDARMLPDYSFARVVLSYDAYMSNLNPRSYLAYSKLCRLAVKAYIWSKCRINIDRGQLSAGVDIGIIREIIDEYKEANEMYLDYLKGTMKKVLTLNDGVKHRRLITRMIGGYS